MINQAQETVMNSKVGSAATTTSLTSGSQSGSQSGTQPAGSQNTVALTSAPTGVASPVAPAANPVNTSSHAAGTTQVGASVGSSVGASNVATSSKTKIIKRYQNRKLYDTQQSCYVTLDDIAKMIRTNEDVMVIDNKTKNDITAATLTQIIFEAEKKASQYAPLFTLREIIQNANGSISSYLAKLGAFPKDYAKAEPAPAVHAGTEKTSYDDIKQTLENRVAKAATETTEFNNASKFIDDQTPSLPNSNKSLNQ